MALPSGEGLSRLKEDPTHEPVEPCCKSAGPIVRVCKFRGMSHGDRVFVIDHYWVKFAGIPFTFLNYSENVESGIGWVEAYGGLKGHEAIMSFPVDAIHVPLKR